MMKDFFRAFRLQLRFRRRALARRKTVLAASFALATIPNALLSCKAKDTTNNSGLQAAAAAKNTVTTDNTAIANNTVIESDEIAADTKSTTAPTKIDLDLTKMSATMIYTTIFDMLVMPEDYVEKNIKLKGWFETYTDQLTGEIFYAVVVPDATACCQQGLEFVWLGDHKYPEDFPKEGADLTVTGIYKLIENDGITYNYIEASSLNF